MVSKYFLKSYKKSKVTGNIFENVLARRFDGWDLHEVLTSDLTYIPLEYTKFAYICFIIGLFNREIIGYNVSDKHNTQCVMETFNTLAFNISEVKIFHCDKDGEFRSNVFVNYITSNGIEMSMSNAGTPHDNAVSENLLSILKAEWTQEIYDNIDEIGVHIDAFVNWYNNFRIHSYINYNSPVEFRYQRNEEKKLLFG